MKILYLTNAPIPKNRETDAHFQELDLLVDTFGGEIISTFPLSRPSSLLPRFMYGMHNRFEIKKAMKKADIVHVFSPIMHPYRYLRAIVDKPLIYSILTPVEHPKKMKNVNQFVVYDAASQKRFLSAGIKYVATSPPYVDFEKNILDVPATPFSLLMASAPWEKSQFESKGIYLLLEVLSQIPDLHITFIWRDVLYESMKKLVSYSSNAERIKLINGRVNINEYLQSTHAVVLLAKNPNLVKSYPHSLMEGMLSGRPILTTSTIPISKEIKENNYGQVLTSFDVEALQKGIIELKNNYSIHVDQLKNLPTNHFGKASFLQFYQDMYERMM